MNKIKYIGFHHCYDKNLKKNFGLAGTNKMEYVVKVLNKDLDMQVELVSPSWYSSTSKLSSKIKNSYFIRISTPNSLKFENKTIQLFNMLYSNIWLFFYLLFKTKSHEAIIVYHSPWLSLPILLAKAIKKTNIILEVEEVYSDVWKIPIFFKFLEKKIINNANSYIVVSEKLGKMLPNKPKVVLYGSYWKNNFLKNSLRNTEMIEVVYCGAIDPYLGGAFNLVRSAKYLNQNININILGYAASSELEELRKLIFETNKLVNREVVKFHGLMVGEEFNNFLQGCDVGINPQNEGDHMNSAFPSKILTYFSNDLLVVSTNVAGVKESKIKNNIIFTKDDKIESIAETLNTLSLTERKGTRDIISNLEKDFVKNLRKILILK